MNENEKEKGVITSQSSSLNVGEILILLGLGLFFQIHHPKFESSYEIVRFNLNENLPFKNETQVL